MAEILPLVTLEEYARIARVSTSTIRRNPEAWGMFKLTDGKGNIISRRWYARRETVEGRVG